MSASVRLRDMLEPGGPGVSGTAEAAGPRPTVAVALPHDAEILGCVSRAAGALARFILVGEERLIRRVAEEHALRLSEVRFVHGEGDEAACALAVDLVRRGEAQLLMKGQVHTATFTRAVLSKERGLVDPGRLISHVALAEIPSYRKPLLLTDCGIAIAPGLEEKVQILRNALEVARALGMRAPKVACVAPVETVNPKIEATVHARELEDMGRRGDFGDALVQGPLGFDLAVCAEAGGIKGVSGPVVGDADIVLLPELNAANVLYKALTCFASATMASVVAGARVPVVLTSRADTERTRYLSLALAVRLAERRGVELTAPPIAPTGPPIAATGP